MDFFLLVGAFATRVLDQMIMNLGKHRKDASFDNFVMEILTNHTTNRCPLIGVEHAKVDQIYLMTVNRREEKCH